MTVRTIAMLTAVALLAACKPAGGDDVVLENVSLAEATEKARSANQLEPGQWESQTKILSLEIPGAPEQVRAAMEKSIAAKTTKVSDCLTPEEAAKPAADMFAGSPAGECRYEKFSMTGGKMDSAMVCKNAAQGGDVRMTMLGDYKPTGFALDMTMMMPAGMIPGGQGMTMRARTEGKRIGECTAPAAGAATK